MSEQQYNQQDELMAVQLQAVCGDLRTLALVTAYATRRGLDPLTVAKQGLPRPMSMLEAIRLIRPLPHKVIP